MQAPLKLADIGVPGAPFFEERAARRHDKYEAAPYASIDAFNHFFPQRFCGSRCLERRAAAKRCSAGTVCASVRRFSDCGATAPHRRIVGKIFRSSLPTACPFHGSGYQTRRSTEIAKIADDGLGDVAARASQTLAGRPYLPMKP